ncbi:MAG: VanZ family protein [Neglectibacter timonensis]
MSIKDVAFVAVILGVLGILILAMLISLGYFVLYKRLMKGQKKLTLRRTALQMLLIACVFIVLGATLLLRTASGSGRTDLQPFSQYRSAWYNFSYPEWRNIVLNIAMFIPFGVLIPVLYPKLRAVWKITAICLVGTLLIETTQLITHRGIFAVDDILHNVLGGVIGYGLFYFVFLLMGKRFQAGRLIAALLPLLVTIASFSGIYAYYQGKEYGIVTETYINRIDMKNISLSNEAELSDEPAEALLYQTSGMASQEQIHAFADGFFSAIGAAPDESLTQKHDRGTYFYANSPAGDELCLGVRNFAMTYTYEDFSAFQHEKTMPGEGEIRKQLDELGVQVPETAEFSQEKKSRSRFDAVPDSKGALSMWGYLECESYDDGTIKYVENNIVRCYPLKPATIISEQAAYEKIAKGMFRCGSQLPVAALHVKAVGLTYCMDTKGFLQPAYCFQTEIDGQEQKLVIPAM